MTDRQSGWAYDPIHDEDVQIDCHPQHQSTHPENIDGDELPVTTNSDFRHDPVEGCQGTYSMIDVIDIEDGCPNCGYDRMTVTVHTLPGEQTETCRACGADLRDAQLSDDYTPRRSKSPAERVREHGDKLGRTRRNGIDVYQRPTAPGLYTLVRDVQTFGIHRKDVTQALGIILDSFERGEMTDSTARWLISKMADANVEPDEEADDE